MAMDERFLMNEARRGCIREKCNNRKSGFQWCTTYSCSYDRVPPVNKAKIMMDEIRQGENIPYVVEEQRAAQKIVMERLREKWKMEADRIEEETKKDELNQLLKTCYIATEEPFPNFELLPDGPKRYNKKRSSDLVLSNAAPCAYQPPCVPCSSGDAYTGVNVDQLPGDIMEPRQTLTQMDNWKGEPFPFQRPEYELLIPANGHTLYLNPTTNPFAYYTRKKKQPAERCYSLKKIPERTKRHEVYGHECSITDSTNSLGFRAQRKHFKEPTTFLWTPPPEHRPKDLNKDEGDNEDDSGPLPVNYKVPYTKLGYRPKVTDNGTNLSF